MSASLGAPIPHAGVATFDQNQWQPSTGISGNFRAEYAALAKPATLDVGFIRKMGFIDKEDFYRLLRLMAPDGGNNFCHPGFFFSAVGAFRGTVLAKRL